MTAVFARGGSAFRLTATCNRSYLNTLQLATRFFTGDLVDKISYSGYEPRIFKVFLMTKTFSQKQASRWLSRQIAVLQMLNREGISLPAAVAFLLIAGETMQLENPRLPNVSDLKDELRMKTVSGASRVLANLADPSGPALIANDRGIRGTRSEAFFLTPKGHELVETILATLSEGEVESFKAYTLPTFAQARFVEGMNSTTLRQVSWDEDTLTLILTPATQVSNEIKEWAREFLSRYPDFHIDGENAVIKFNTVADAVYFKLRWC